MKETDLTQLKEFAADLHKAMEGVMTSEAVGTLFWFVRDPVGIEDKLVEAQILKDAMKPEFWQMVEEAILVICGAASGLRRISEDLGRLAAGEKSSLVIWRDGSEESEDEPRP